MKFKDYPVGWSEIEHQGKLLEKWRTLLLMLPNGKYKLMGYRKNPYGRKNGHYYWCHAGFVSKSLDKAQDYLLDRVRTDAMSIVNFVDKLKTHKIK